MDKKVLAQNSVQLNSNYRTFPELLEYVIHENQDDITFTFRVVDGRNMAITSVSFEGYEKKADKQQAIDQARDLVQFFQDASAELDTAIETFVEQEM